MTPSLPQTLPKPYYEEKGIVIYNCDCRTILPHLPKFDLLLTDPPYGIGQDGSYGFTRSGSGWQGRKKYAFRGWDFAPPSEECFRLMFAASNEQVIWGANYFTEVVPASMGWLVWAKGQDGQLCQSDGELAFTSRDSALRIFTLHRSLLWAESPQHPTQKPLALMKWCLSLFPDAKIVLDPFLGSGTTLVAAKAMGLSAVGIELHEPYAEIAANRLRQEVFDFA